MILRPITDLNVPANAITRYLLCREEKYSASYTRRNGPGFKW